LINGFGLVRGLRLISRFAFIGRRALRRTFRFGSRRRPLVVVMTTDRLGLLTDARRARTARTVRSVEIDAKWIQNSLFFIGNLSVIDQICFEMTKVNSVKKCPKTKDDRKFFSNFGQMTEMFQRKKNKFRSLSPLAHATFNTGPVIFLTATHKSLLYKDHLSYAEKIMNPSNG